MGGVLGRSLTGAFLRVWGTLGGEFAAAGLAEDANHLVTTNMIAKTAKNVMVELSAMIYRMFI